MCHKAPAPRCTYHAGIDLDKATDRLNAIIATAERAVAKYKQFGDATPEEVEAFRKKQDRRVVASKARYERRDWDFSVAVLGGEKNARTRLNEHTSGAVALSAQDVAKYTRTIERCDELRTDPVLYEKARRERFLRATLEGYLKHLKNGGDPGDSPLTHPARLTVDALTFLEALPRTHTADGGGRDLTEPEQELLARAREHLATSPDYLPIEESVEQVEAEPTPKRQKRQATSVLPTPVAKPSPKKSSLPTQRPGATTPPPLPPRVKQTVDTPTTKPAPLPPLPALGNPPATRRLPQRRVSPPAPKKPERGKDGYWDKLLGG